MSPVGPESAKASSFCLQIGLVFAGLFKNCISDRIDHIPKLTPYLMQFSLFSRVGHSSVNRIFFVVRLEDVYGKTTTDHRSCLLKSPCHDPLDQLGSKQKNTYCPTKNSKQQNQVLSCENQTSPICLFLERFARKIRLFLGNVDFDSFQTVRIVHQGRYAKPGYGIWPINLLH